MRPCPTCLTSCRSLAVAPSIGNLKGFFTRRTKLQPTFLKKHFVTSTTSRALSSSVEPLTILHKTVALLPNVPSYVDGFGSSQVQASDLWEPILSNAYNDLSAVTDRPIKIAVLGVDEWSRSEDVVTALLADPLSSNEDHFTRLNSRWSDPTLQKIEILYGPEEDNGSPSLMLPSPFLTQFPVPMELSEFRPSATKSSRSTPSLWSNFQNRAIYDVDIPIVVCNPLTTPLSSVLSAQLPINSVLIVTSTISQADLDSIVQQYICTLPSSARLHARTPTVISVDPKRAVEAVRTIQAQHGSLSAIQKFQDDFITSNISAVTHALRRKLTSTRSSPWIRKNMAISHINDALQWSSTSVRDLCSELDRAFLDVSAFKERIEETQMKAANQVFGYQDGGVGKMQGSNAVTEAIKEAELELKAIMGRLSWWRMVWRVDEISSILSAGLKEMWCNNLEKKLILSTGELSAIQTDISESAFALLTNHRAVNTAVLRNALLQCKTSPGHPLTPVALTGPIQSRRNQLIEYPTTRLHIAGQRAVLGMVTGTVTGVGISWAGWLGWLLGSSESLLGFLTLEPGTAMGIGMLTAAASVRWSIGYWEKAKKRWWEDWRRVGKGLDRDLKATLDRIMDRQVLIIGQMACKDLTQSIRAREKEVAEVSKVLQEVQSTLDALASADQERS